jgi:hypothetical protein
MEQENVKVKDLERLANFDNMTKKIIAINDTAYRDGRWGANTYKATKKYTKAEVVDILENGNPLVQQQLSLNYFYLNGFYRRIVLLFSNILAYAGVVVPHIKNGKSFEGAATRKYANAVDFVEAIGVPDLCTTFAWKAIVNGTYYGLLVSYGKETIGIIDLPYAYCRTRFKDEYGNYLIEFDLSYFDMIFDKEYKVKALEAYPKIIQRAYIRYTKDVAARWFRIPSDLGICFPLFDGKPLLLNVLPAAIDFEEYVGIEKQRDLTELKKILVQKIPHISTTGELVFEPEEATTMHEGAVDMLKHNENVSVLTTYADVELESVIDTRQTINNTLKNAMDVIYGEAGVSRELFSSTGNLALDKSIANILSLMMVLARQIDRFLTRVLNAQFSNSTVSFKYLTLPISYYNRNDFITDSFKLAQSGYSLIIPALALGISQRDLVDLKDLENVVLDLRSKLQPPASSYTQGGESSEGGRPKKPADEKADKTLDNEESLDKGGKTDGSE